VLTLPDETLVYPGHDYKGDTVSTIGEEKAFNPRLQVSSAEEYAAIMDNLNLPNPKLMDVAVPANIKVGLSQDEIEARGWSLTAAEVMALGGDGPEVLIDLRDPSERERHGEIAGAMHAPYPDLDENVGEHGLLHQLAAAGKALVFFCAYGERSAMAVEAARAAGIGNARHLKGGIDAWKKAGGEIES